MNITYEVLKNEDIHVLRDLVNELMSYQKSKATIMKEIFDSANYETRLVSSVDQGKENYVVAAKDGEEYIGFSYATITPKSKYQTPFGDLFDMESVPGDYIGCFALFFLREAYRGRGIGSKLYRRAMEWLKGYQDKHDIFVFVSNGNDAATKYYQDRDFQISHLMLNGFITVLKIKPE